MDYQNIKNKLDGLGQTQLLEYFEQLDSDQRAALLEDIENTNFSVIDTIKERPAEEKGDIAPCSAKDLNDIAIHREEYTQEGLKLLRENKVAAVLLAGGQGTRLGFDKPKGMFNIGETRSLYIFEQLMSNIKDVTSRTGVCFPIFIMTSEINHGDTVGFFKEHSFFGYPENKIHFYIQDTEPVCDLNGKIFLSEKHRVAKSPNGNGGWYSSLINSGLGKVLESEGIEWINVFGVDNVLQRICDPVFIGATSLSGANSGAKVVSKSCPEERVGVLCKKGGRPAIVEYYEMPEHLAKERDAAGELVYKYGVILNYLFRVNVLNEIIAQKLPYHLAQKAIPHIENGVMVKPTQPNGYKFETLVVDMVKFMGSCVAFEVEREREFAPVKNKTGVDSVETARALLKLNGVKL